MAGGNSREPGLKHLLPPLLLLGASAALGLWLGIRYLRREPRKPVHVGVHILLGVVGLEGMAMLLRGTPDGTILPAGPVGNAAGLLLILTVMSGFATPMIARRTPRNTGTLALATHAGLGAAGIGLFFFWALGQ